MITWLEPGGAFPPLSHALGMHTSTPGLLAAGGRLDVPTLIQAYSHGVFPWYSDGQPILWWSTDPRMVLPVAEFQLHRSFRKKLRQFRASARCEIRFDSAFAAVLQACAGSPRPGQRGTWIVPAMREAYGELHRAGHAHSVETWMDGELVGGLYCVALGRAVFGESMFSAVPDASKLSLAALVAFCREHDIEMIDCQQNTPHLASLGAREIGRASFCDHVARQCKRAGPTWQWRPVYWNQIAT